MDIFTKGLDYFKSTEDKRLGIYLCDQGFQSVKKLPRNMYLGSLHNSQKFKLKDSGHVWERGTSVYMKSFMWGGVVKTIYVVYTIIPEKTYLFDLYIMGDNPPEWFQYPLTWQEGFGYFKDLTEKNYENFDAMSFLNKERMERRDALNKLRCMVRMMFPKLSECLILTYGGKEYTFKSRGVRGLQLYRKMDGSVMLLAKKVQGYVVDVFTESHLYDTRVRTTMVEARDTVDSVLKLFKS